MPLALRRRIERLSGLPLRAASVRFVLQSLPEDAGPGSEPLDSPRSQLITEIDPGWVLGRVREGSARDILGVIAEQSWWPQLDAAAAEALLHLWRHSVAVSQAARRIARDAGDPDPDRIARAGLLHGLGRWAVAAIDPEWLVLWLAETDPARRRALEHRSLDTELTTLGRVLAERWGCEGLVVDAAWLHEDADGSLNGCALEPARLALIQRAFAWAEQTPWSLGCANPGAAVREGNSGDPRLRLLIAEVQVRCGGPLVDADTTPHEEQWARSNARLRRQISQLRHVEQSRDRFLSALASADAAESPETWAERAGLFWCGEPGVTAARVVWTGPQSGAESPAPAAATGRVLAETAADRGPNERTPDAILRLGEPGQSCAEIHLWTSEGAGDKTGTTDAAEREVVRRAWQGWAALVAQRARYAVRLERAVETHRDRLAGEEPRLRQAKLAALAEFAAGAGHELNNPLAVIVGRAQLLLVREQDPAAVRSLRAILNQAQRAHRILRDLMYVARPPEPRPRYCQMEEVLRNCLRDVKASSEERGVQIAAEARGSETRVWADPDALRHLTEVLLRNALEATSKGGMVQLRTSTVAAADGAPQALTWVVEDNGRGITTVEGEHLFDPFYCGRQAGRGLGLGLPRAARIVSQAGGEIRWHSAPGQGTTFHVHLPLTEPPRAPAELGVPLSLAPKDDQPLPRS